MAQKTGPTSHSDRKAGRTASGPKRPRDAKAGAATQLDVDAQSVGETVEQQYAYLDFGTPEQLAKDDAAWREKLAATTDAQLEGLERIFEQEENRDGRLPLDFNGK